MFRKSQPPPGSRPGTLAIPQGSSRPHVRVVSYDAEGITERDIQDVEELSAFVAPDRTTWVDIHGFGDEALLRRIGVLFGIDPLALEDAINVPHRATSEIRGAHQVVIARPLQRREDGTVAFAQVCLLFAGKVLISFQERPLALFDPVRTRLREGIGPMRRHGPDYLAYALLDTIVDRYFPVVEGLAHDLERIEEEVLEGAPPEALGALHVVRRQLVLLRRIGWPQREALASLLRDPSAHVSNEVRGFLRDTSDHMVQIMEVVDSCRDMTVGLMDLHLSTLGHHTNEVMKLLTLMASLFIPLTFLAGLYGMNFHNMPELDQPWAYPVVLGVMALVAAAMLLWFRRRGWIGRGGRVRGTLPAREDDAPA